MSIKTVLSVVGVSQFKRDVQTTLDLCAQIEAHLSILVVAMASPPPIGGYAAVLSAPWLEERENDLAMLEARVKEVEALAAKNHLSVDLDREYTEMAWADMVVGERARYADLTVIGPDLMRDGELKYRAIDGVLFNSGRPLVIVPSDKGSTMRPGIIMLAWDSRIAAVRAAREALEILCNAERVHVTIVDPEAASGRDGPEPGAEIATYLAHHGARVVVDRIPSAGIAIAEVLQQHALDISANLVVMGAYGHSRMRERVFGGVTRSMIEKTKLPVFMAH